MNLSFCLKTPPTKYSILLTYFQVLLTLPDIEYPTKSKYSTTMIHKVSSYIRQCYSKEGEEKKRKESTKGDTFGLILDNFVTLTFTMYLF